MTRIDEATELQIIADYRAGIFYKDLMRKYHLSHEPLKRILKKHGVYNSRRPDYSNAPKEEIAREYTAKTPIKEILEKYDLSKDALYDIVRATSAESNFRLKAEQESSIIEQYQNDTPLREIAQSVGFAGGLVETVLTENGIERDRRLGASRLDLDEAEGFYQEGMSLIEMSAHYNVDRGVISRWFNNEGVKRKTHSEACQVYDLNPHYFSNPNRPDVAYFLGFLWADGCNKTYQNEVQLIVNARDEDIVLKLRAALGSTHPIRYYDAKMPSGKIGHYCDLNITNEVLSNELEGLGMVRAKTYAESLVLPKGINDEMTRHFLRGLIDGDGWFTIAKRGALDFNLGVAGHEDLLAILSDYIAQKVGVSSTIREVCLWNPDRCKTRRLDIGGNRNALKFLQWLYEDSGGIRLDRKYAIYRNIVARYFAEIKGAHKLAHLNFFHP